MGFNLGGRPTTTGHATFACANKRYNNANKFNTRRPGRGRRPLRRRNFAGRPRVILTTRAPRARK
eukprot:7212187-Lingulodinium_polyedra.AAC.1